MVQVVTPAQAAASIAESWSTKMLWFSLVLGLVGIIAILGLVFGAIAYANTLRSSRMILEELKRCRGQNNHDGVMTVELFDQKLNVITEPGQADQHVTSISIENKTGQVPVNAEFMLVLSVARHTNAPEEAASGTVSFAGNTTNFSIPPMVGAVEVPVTFTYAQVQGGALVGVTLTNSGTIPLLVSRARIVARQPYASTSTNSRGGGSGAESSKKKRGFKLF